MVDLTPKYGRNVFGRRRYVKPVAAPAPAGQRDEVAPHHYVEVLVDLTPARGRNIFASATPPDGNEIDRVSVDGQAPAPPPEPRSGRAAEPSLSVAEIKSRAASGAALVLGRGVVYKVLGFCGNLVLARLLTPRDFGLVALGLTIISLGQFLASAGLGTALVTRTQAPSRDELRAITGLQLVITSAIGAVAAGVAAVVSHSALVTAFMMLALPLTAFRTPVMLLLQRELAFNISVRIELTEIVVYLIVAVGAAATGLGAWALAIATVVRVAAGTIVACVVSPVGALMPSLRFSLIREILAFGARFQAAELVQLGQDIAVTASIASFGGISVLGLWSFASRILQIPFMLFEAMWSVGMPAFSRMLDAGEQEMRSLLERTVGTTALGVAMVVCPLCASGPCLVPLIFGHVWKDVSLILPGSGLALVVFGPISISGYGYLVASGDAKTPLQGTIAATIVRLGATAALLPTVGAAGIGLAWAFGCLAEVPLVLGRIRRSTGARLERAVIRPALISLLAGACGWVVATRAGVTIAGAAESIAVSSVVFAALLWLFGRRDLTVAVTLVRRGYAAARRKVDLTPVSYGEA